MGDSGKDKNVVIGYEANTNGTDTEDSVIIGYQAGQYSSAARNVLS